CISLLDSAASGARKVPVRRAGERAAGMNGTAEVGNGRLAAENVTQDEVKPFDQRMVYDALLLPALNYAERDRLEGRLSEAEESLVSDSTRELITDAGD